MINCCNCVCITELKELSLVNVSHLLKQVVWLGLYPHVFSCIKVLADQAYTVIV